MSKIDNLKFEDFKVKTPSLKRISSRFEAILTELEKSTSASEALKAIKKWNKYSDSVQTDFSIIYVRYSLNTTDPVAKKNQNLVDSISPYISSYNNRYIKFLLNCPFRKELEDKFGSYVFEMYEAQLKTFDEKIIPDLVTENQLVSKYDAIIGSAEIEFRGEKLNISQLGKYSTSEDRATRREASLLLDNWFFEHEQEIGDIYSQLVTLRDKIAHELGFESFVELGYLRLGRLDYNHEDAKKYRDQITKEVVPLSTKLFKEQMKSLGIRNPQYYDYNLSFKTGNPKPVGDEAVLVKKAEEMYKEMSKETGDFFLFMEEHHLMDLSSRSGKVGGGYCTYFPDYKAPFIFSNFNGTEGDVNVLTHEFGHAFQAYLSSNIRVPEYRSPTLEACEIHSMSMEFFAWPYADNFFDNGDKYRYSHLKDAITFLPYGISIDEFQHWVYEYPTATHMERCQKWKEIESKNLPNRKFDECKSYSHGSWWIKQSHIFGSPFYYIDYTLAQVVAFQFFIESRKNKERAWKKYVKLCKFGGKAPFVTLLKQNNLRNPFLDGNVKKAIAPLKKILKEFDISNF
ncbi:MAG: M3 family oligoendopeptidase [Bacilli bacterium]